MTDLRVTQVQVEVLTDITSPELRVAQVPVEALTTDAGTLRVSQVGLEALYNQGTATPLRVSQIGLEVLRSVAVYTGPTYNPAGMLLCL